MKIGNIAIGVAYLGSKVLTAIAVGATKVWEGVSKYIKFKDPVVEQLCMKWSSDGIGLTPEDASKVTDIGTTFKGNTEITSFEELEQFDGMTKVPAHAFRGCIKLNKLSLPLRIEALGPQAIYNTAVENIVVPDNVVSLSQDALRHNKFMRVLSIGSNINWIGWEQCTGNTRLERVILFATTPPLLEEGTEFRGTYLIYVPDQSVDLYKSATNWTVFANRIRALSVMQKFIITPIMTETSSPIIRIPSYYYAEKVTPVITITPNDYSVENDTIIFSKQGVYHISAEYEDETVSFSCRYSAIYDIVNEKGLNNNGTLDDSISKSVIGPIDCLPSTKITWGSLMGSTGILCEYDSDGNVVDYWGASSNPRTITTSSRTTMIKATLPTRFLNLSYITDSTNNRYLWKGHSLNI